MDTRSSIASKGWLCCFTSSVLILLFLCEYSQNSIVKFSLLQSVVLFQTLPNVTQFSSFSDEKLPEHLNFSDIIGVSEAAAPDPRPVPPLRLTEDARKIKDGARADKMVKEDECDIYDGTWVYSPESAPLYNAAKCQFLSDQVSCRRNGRRDSGYEKWVWEAKGCEIPRFNGRDMLERLRGKRLIIVGDSLNRNQWESLACLLYTSVNPREASVDSKRNYYKVFRAKRYNCSIEFYWNPLLVHLEDDHEIGKKVLKLDKVHAAAWRWRGADIMVFNSGHWWTHRGRLRTWDFYELEGKLVQDMETEKAFEIGMKTWARWVEENVDRSKTKVFFRSISPEHKGKHECTNQTEPTIEFKDYNAFPRTVKDAVERILAGMKVPVKYLNITDVSLYRRDAHPSYYATRKGKILMRKKENNYHPDCSHWCLPGVPDTWNILLYASMVFDSSRDTPGSSYSVI